MKRNAEASEELYREELREIDSAERVFNDPAFTSRVANLEAKLAAEMRAAETLQARDDAWYLLKALDRLKSEFTTVIDGKENAISKIRTLQKQAGRR